MSTSTSASTRATRGYAIALASAAVLSTTAVFIRYLTQTYHLPALVLAFWRDVFVVVTLWIVLGVWQPHLLRVTHDLLPYLAVYGLVLASFNALWTLAVALNGAAIATVLAYCSAAFTALLGRWLLEERLDGTKVVAVALCLAGCVLVAGALDPAAWRANPVGILTGVLSGLGYSAYTLMGRSASQRGLDPWTTILYVFACAAVTLLVVNLLGGGMLPGSTQQPGDLLWLGRDWVGWGILFLLAAGPTVVGFGLYNVSLGYLSSSVVNLIVTAETVFTAILAYFLLGERLTQVQLVGSAMILAGVLFLRVREGTVSQQE